MLVAALFFRPLLSGGYTLVLLTDILVFALFAVSLHFIAGPAGLHSFGHAAYFGLGAYGVGRTFQITATFGSMTVRENVQMALLSHARRLGSLFSSFSVSQVEEANSLLGRVGMLEQAERHCAVLAYGDLKRVELAVALANAPRLLLMDEPTAGMAPRERSDLMQLAADLARRSNIAVLFTEHDMDVVFTHADRIVVMADGELIAEGDPERVRADARVREVYLGSHA